MPYQPIENYGVIGNMRTAALVGKNGSIDWFCLPRFDSPSVFAAILDDTKGGYFRIAPTAEDVAYKQVYWSDTNVLVTRFFSTDGVGQIEDFMPLDRSRSAPTALVRRVKTVRGAMRFRMECRPAFNYARDRHQTRISERGAKFHSRSLTLALSSSVKLTPHEKGVAAEFTLGEGKCAVFELYQLESASGSLHRGFSVDESEELFQRTIEYWRAWVSKCTYRGRWRETVTRSALALKLLTYEPTGAIIAAPTCSLPESMGGTRNWDYRYSWIRDSAFTVYGLMRIGFTEEAAQFTSFLDARCREMDPDGSLQVAYRVDGSHDLREETLDHLQGYCGSAPVRIGNAAFQQVQLDIYGELMDSMYLYNKYGTPISYDLWVYLRRLTNWVCAHWRDKDDAIWEVRGGPQQFVFSKMMCWVALDRALRLADKRSFPADWREWYRTRDRIYEDIMKRGFNAKRGTFVQRYGNDALDASCLLMPLVFFVSPTDSRILQTIDAINKPPKEGGLVSDGLVFRYDVQKTPDGLKSTEGTFNLCTFWLVEALTRAGKEQPERLQKALLLFEQMLGYANHLGLFAEQTSHQGSALGNFPQGLTHLALISAAYNLDRYLDGERRSK
jgi:GH15 family glucan-1,4-alpha-glucosidase